MDLNGHNKSNRYYLKKRCNLIHKYPKPKSPGLTNNVNLKILNLNKVIFHLLFTRNHKYHASKIKQTINERFYV